MAPYAGFSTTASPSPDVVSLATGVGKSPSMYVPVDIVINAANVSVVAFQSEPTAAESTTDSFGTVSLGSATPVTFTSSPAVFRPLLGNVKWTYVLAAVN